MKKMERSGDIRSAEWEVIRAFPHKCNYWCGPITELIGQIIQIYGRLRLDAQEPRQSGRFVSLSMGHSVAPGAGNLPGLKNRPAADGGGLSPPETPAIAGW